MALCNAMSLSNEVAAARRHLPWHCLLKSGVTNLLPEFGLLKFNGFIYICSFFGFVL